MKAKKRKRKLSGIINVRIGADLQKRWTSFCNPTGHRRNLVSNLVSAALTEYMRNHADDVSTVPEING